MPSPSTTTPPADSEFDPLVFWIQHKTKILMLILVLLVGFGTFGISEWVRTNKEEGAKALFASANSLEGYRKVIAEYPGTTPAASAYLLVAEKLREQGKYDESTKELQTFLQKFPQHQLVSGAWTSIAANQEAQGKVDEALSTYQKVSTGYANSFSAPLALMAQARILQAKGKTEDARRIYEQVMTQYRDNFAAQQAAMEVRKLKK
jgi:TolA-binding protein